MSRVHLKAPAHSHPTRGIIPLFGRLFLLILAALVLPAGHAGARSFDKYTKTGLRWPTDASRRLTSTFGELRPDRFHAGLDFSTGGNVGYPCYAIDDGYVFRVKTSFNGYGRVVYLRLKNNRIVVYGHLSAFDPRIEKRIRAEQLKQGWYEVELFLPPGDITFKKGDVIGYSGDTGSGPPHLHFEMRHGIDEPYNPTLEGFKVADRTPPVIRHLSIRPLDGGSEVEGDMLPVIRPSYGRKPQPVDVYGRMGISVEAADWQDGGWHRLGVRILELYLNGTLRHRTTLDRFHYRNNRDSRLDFDYELGRIGLKRFRRLYVLDGNELEFYDPNLPGGVIDTRTLKPGPNEVRVRVVDEAGNASSVTWTLNVLDNPTLPPSANNGPPRPLPQGVPVDSSISVQVDLSHTTAHFQVENVPEWARTVQVRSNAMLSEHGLVARGGGRWVGRGEISLDFRGPCTFTALVEGPRDSVEAHSVRMNLAGFRAGSGDRWSVPDEGFEMRVGSRDLWSDCIAALTTRPGDTRTDAKYFHLEPMDYPLERPIIVAFTSEEVPWDSSDVIVYRDMSKGGRWTYLANDREMNGFVLKGEAWSFETFTVMRDTVAPRISNVSLVDGARASTRRPRLAATVVDRLSGLDLENCSLQLDGKDTIWIYDPDLKTISYRPWDDLTPGLHTWKLFTVDKVGNVTAIERSFRVR